MGWKHISHSYIFREIKIVASMFLSTASFLGLLVCFSSAVPRRKERFFREDVVACENHEGNDMLPCDFVPPELIEELCTETAQPGRPAFGDYCCATCRAAGY